MLHPFSSFDGVTRKFAAEDAKQESASRSGHRRRCVPAAARGYAVALWAVPQAGQTEQQQPGGRRGTQVDSAGHICPSEARL